MMLRFKIIIALVSLSFFAEIDAQDWDREKLTIYQTFDDMESLLHLDNDTTYLINFWATWCGPCVKELPYFEAVNKRFKDKPYKTILISLDLEKKIDTKLIPFLNKHKIESEVVLLLDGKAHKWIDRVDPQWSGAIPITIVRRGERYNFYEKEFHSEQELANIVAPILNN